MDQRETFLREYIDLIGSLSRELNSLIWWATDMSSKNRSTCKLPFLLHKFRSIVASMEGQAEQGLNIPAVCWVLIGSLKSYMSKEGIQYRLTAKSPGWKEAFIMRMRTVARILYVMGKSGARKLYFTLKLRKIINSISSEKKYYVIKTFLYDHSFNADGKYKDIFFGSLPDFLAKNDKVIILADVLGRPRYLADMMKRCESHLIVPLEIFLPVKDMMRAAFQVLFKKITISRRYSFFGDDVTDIIKDELKRTSNGIPFYQFLHYPMMKHLLKYIRVDNFLLTYENNPWEKMCMMAIQEASPSTNIIGYQHSVVPQASANAFISKIEADIIPKPDKILTVGDEPRKIMEKYGFFEPGKIEAACGLRFEYLFRSSRQLRKKDGHILLALEGLEGAHKLINYAMAQLRGNPFYQVHFRTHPEMPLSSFESKLSYPLSQSPNFMQTKNAMLKDDLEWADVVMYWGSTVSLEALIAGRPIIRYNMDIILDYDPLFECSHFKWIVSDNTSLVDVLEEIYALDDASYDRAWEAARKYLSQYFFPVTEDRLAMFKPQEERRP